MSIPAADNFFKCEFIVKKNEEDKMEKIKPGKSEKRTMLLLQAYFWGCCNHKEVASGQISKGICIEFEHR
ncbi:MAG: hypothetical protein V5804_03775 [Mucilaginibacter sp.]|uniref:hypothetical protein n=1 Tax=Mucilaginibacter sp. TaxID=1882438 RepID=UPI0034E57A1D